MPSSRGLVCFVSLVALFYGLLAIPWPGLQQGYAAVYRTVAAPIFGSFGAQGLVLFRPHHGSKAYTDTAIIMVRRGSEIGSKFYHSARRDAYLPTAEVIALILATPLPWRRRWKALLWGLVWIHVLIALRMLITLAHGYDGDAPWSLYALSPLWSKTLYGAYEVIVRSPTSSFLLPVFIWIAVSFRSSDWEIMTPVGRVHRQLL